MSDTKHPAEVLADKLAQRRIPRWTHATSQTPQQHGFALDRECLEASNMLRRIPALEAERDTYRARLDRAIAAAEEHFGEDAIRYKLSLFKNGRDQNIFPDSMDGRWVALQRADNDAHIGLSLRVAEAEAERDQLHAEVMEQARLLGMSGERELALRAEIDRLRKDAERHGR